MDYFYKITIMVAVIILILVLTYIGITMGNRSYTTSASFPPQYGSCPDYWDAVRQDDQIFCKVPLPEGDSGNPNVGQIYDSDDTLILNTSNTSEFQDNVIEFDEIKWGGICEIKTWCDRYGIVWDGVTNYNKC